MKFLIDFLPILLFFLSFKWAGAHPEQAQAFMLPILSSLSNASFNPNQLPILLATTTAIVVTSVQIVIQKCMGKAIDNMQWIGLALITVFGGLTLVFQNETFIKWKPTILYVAMALGFVVAKVLKRNPIQLMMKGQVELPTAIWDRLLWAWVIFFCAMGVINIMIAYNFSTDIWVDFKLFGSLGATLVFVIGQGMYMSKHIKTHGEVRS